MRSIIDDLHERVRETATKYADEQGRYDEETRIGFLKHREIIESLDRERRALETMLEIEMARGATAAVAERKVYRLPLAEFVITKLAVGGPLSKEELRREANLAGYDDPGRALHMTIQNIAKGGKIFLQPDGRYCARDFCRNGDLLDGHIVSEEDGKIFEMLNPDMQSINPDSAEVSG